MSFDVPSTETLILAECLPRALVLAMMPAEGIIFSGDALQGTVFSDGAR